EIAVGISGYADPAFTSDVRIDLYVDTDDTGYDGVLLQSKVPATFAAAGDFTGTTGADISGLFSGTYFLYLVINDGTNNAVFSAYSTGFRPPQVLQGTVANQGGQPLSGWQVFADLN